MASVSVPFIFISLADSQNTTWTKYLALMIGGLCLLMSWIACCCCCKHMKMADQLNHQGETTVTFNNTHNLDYEVGGSANLEIQAPTVEVEIDADAIVEIEVEAPEVEIEVELEAPEVELEVEVDAEVEVEVEAEVEIEVAVEL